MAIFMIKAIKYFLFLAVQLISAVCFIITLFLAISTFVAMNQVTAVQFINLICALVGCSLVNYLFMLAIEALNSSNRSKEVIYAK